MVAMDYSIWITQSFFLLAGQNLHQQMMNVIFNSETKAVADNNFSYRFFDADNKVYFAVITVYDFAQPYKTLNKGYNKRKLMLYTEVTYG